MNNTIPRKEIYQPLGPIGYYGRCSSEENNEKTDEINQLVDKHNFIINSFNTEKENWDFYYDIVEQINDISKTFKH